MIDQLTIHATNIRGMGASHVVVSLVNSLKNKLKNEEVKIYLPFKSNLFVQDELGNIEVHKLKRILPNSLSRFSESLLSPWYFAKTNNCLVLGDLPLSGFTQQVVLVHQANLIDPRINPHSGKSLKYKIYRWLFKKNLKYVKQVVVQTEAMKEQMIASYPELNSRTSVIPHPAPIWFNSDLKSFKREPQSVITLFYPVSNYPYKNLQLLELMQDYVSKLEFPIQIIVTLNPSEIPASIANLNWINCVGKFKAISKSNWFILSFIIGKLRTATFRGNDIRFADCLFRSSLRSVAV
jgi:hypothetical protein